MSDAPNEALPEAINKGPIAWMAQNSVASNLLMFVIFIGGLIGSFQVIQEVFPAFELDMVIVTVPYPGATPEEVEQGIVLAVEEEVRGVDGVKRITSNSSEGAGVITVELLLGADRQTVLNDVKSAVDSIVTFPEEAEKATVSLLSLKRDVIALIISGDADMQTLQGVAERARAMILQKEEVSQAEVFGVPPLEVSIEIPRATLESLGLSIEQVAAQIKVASLELSGGGLETKGGEILVKVNDRRLMGEEFGNIVIRGTEAGYKVRLGDIATIDDGFEDTNQSSMFNGKGAVQVTAYRIGSETPSDVAAAVREVAVELQEELPEGMVVTVWNDSSQVLDARISLLTRNGMQGLILVVLILALFLDLKLAFWVALGIPISISGAFLMMPRLDVSVNMISLFAFIITLGLVVDDAIVVGENIFEKSQQGMGRLQASIEGAQQMAMPVTFSILTTIAAFSPLYFLPGFMGKIFSIIPLVVSSVLLFSLVEGFFILPAHLAHMKDPEKAGEGNYKGLWGVIRRIQDIVAAGLDRFSNQYYRPTVEWFIRRRYIAMAAGLSLLIITFSLVGAGIVPFEFFPKLEGELITVTAKLPYGANIERTQEVHDILREAGMEALEEVGGEEAFLGAFSRVGQAISGDGQGEVGSHITAIQINIGPSEDRSFSAKQFSEAWSRLTPPLPGLESVVYASSTGPGADAAVSVQLSHNDVEVLAEASRELSEALGRYSDLTDIQNEYSAGKPQLTYHLLPSATTLGLSSSDVARQLRSSFYGSEALREQRGRNELRVMVRLPESERESEYDLEQLLISTPTGAQVPLSSVATLEREVAPTTIRREEGARVITVSAELAPGVESSREALDDIKANVLPGLVEKYDGLSYGFVGIQREMAETMQSLITNGGMALFIMFALLAIPFRSYYQPVIIMSCIPFGIVGAVGGHMLMGYELSMISILGIIALSGVVVNDSLVLIDAANTFMREEGTTALRAIADAGQRRLRPILLTSLTTFFGLMPMILETDLQARFLIPMAISLGFGVLFATVIVLLLVPALFIIMEDIASLFVKSKIAPEEEERLHQEAKAAEENTAALPSLDNNQQVAAFSSLQPE